MNELLDEDELRRFLALAADAAPAPGRAAEDLLAALDDTAAGGLLGGSGDGGDGGDGSTPVPLRRFGGRPPARVVGLAAAVVLVVALLAVTLAGGDDHPTQTAATKRDATTESADSAGGTTGGGDAYTATTIYSPALGTAGAGAPVLGSPNQDQASAPIADSAVPESSPAPSPAGGADGRVADSALADSAKVVKTGSLALEVRKGAFQATVDRITTKAIGYGGYVADSTTASSDSSPSGTITVRVPSDSFDRLLADLRKLGKVQSFSQKGTEVSAQYTDLQARLAAVTATRDRLNVVLSKAITVTDILSVQDRITQVQTEIEQLQGQIHLLDDQTSMGTLAVSLAEPGAKPPVVYNPDDRTIGSSFSEARHRFGNGIEAVIAWSGSAGVVLLFGAVVLVLGRLAWKRYRRLLL